MLIPKMDFQQLEEARQVAGLSFERFLFELNISERTYYRWKQKGEAPYWAGRIIELLSGDLACHGWKDWELKNGRLFCKSLSNRYSWHHSEITKTVFFARPSHHLVKNGDLAHPANDCISRVVEPNERQITMDYGADPDELQPLRGG